MREQRLIDANALIDRIQHSYFPSEIVSITTVTGCFLEDIVSPTIDAVPVVHGHWVEKGQEIYCSACDEESAYTWAGASRFSHYCPNCGAIMDEVAK